ncbi:hypothetical protein VXS05_15750 [Photobacterium toruni]|uniref:hypothetical protein n=1 Tax=Photobacterium toruni TaxID=1935446 RepID=UPI002E1883A2|nr:hypothetical protein [Photobacterium toruni]
MEARSIIQRYMSLDKFLFIIEKHSLFLTKMSKFDDQLEGSLTALDYLDKSNEAGIFDNAINNCFSVYGETPTEREKRLRNSELVTKTLNEATFDTPFGRFSKNETPKIFAKCRENIYVSCWHSSDFECSAMWQLYGKASNALCIVTTVDKLKTQIVNADNLQYKFQLEDVQYLDHSKAEFTNNVIQPFISKALPFSFEKELRLIAYNPQIDIKNTKDDNSNGFIIRIHSLSELIDKIIISPSSEPSFKQRVEKLCCKHGLNIEIKDSSLKRTRIESVWDSMEQLQEE